MITFNEALNIIKENYWLAEIVIVLFLTWLIRRILARSIKNLYRNFLKTEKLPYLWQASMILLKVCLQFH